MASKQHKHICPGCNRQFTSGSPHSKWCSTTCKNRITRRRKEQEQAGPLTGNDRPQPEGLTHPLVQRTRDELEAVGRLDSFAGELAIVLAERLASGASSPAALAKELRVVMAAAMEGVIPPGNDPVQSEPLTGKEQDQAEPLTPLDPLEKARRDRALARQAVEVA